MNKALGAITLIVALVILSLAQRAENNTDEKLKARNAPGLFVFSASAFGPDKKGDSHFTIEVGNTGVKAIRAIEWEYYLSGENISPDARNERFRNDKLKLRPEERLKLTQQVHHYTDDFVKSFNLDTVRIIAVDFEDGSQWQRPTDNK